MAETTQEAGETADPRLAKLVYMLLLFGLIVSPLAVIGLIIAYVQNDTGPAWLNSHYRFQIRTFWLGVMFVVFLISMSGVLAEITILATFFSLVLGLCLLVYVFWSGGLRDVSKATNARAVGYAWIDPKR